LKKKDKNASDRKKKWHGFCYKTEDVKANTSNVDANKEATKSAAEDARQKTT
jgi:hypothetical protein